MCQCYEIKIVSNMKAGFRIYFFTYIVHMTHTSRSRSRSLIGIKLQHHWLWPPQCWFLSIILYNAHNNAKLMNATKIYIAKCSINNCYCTISLYTVLKSRGKVRNISFVIVVQNNIQLNFPWKFFRKEVVSFSSSLEFLPSYLRTFSWTDKHLFSFFRKEVVSFSSSLEVFCAFLRTFSRTDTPGLQLYSARLRKTSCCLLNCFY
jgi:hypothetical protein